MGIERQVSLRTAVSSLPQRAERLDGVVLRDTFNDIGGLGDTIVSHDNKIFYGRRGSGKTHALRFQKELISISENNLAIFIDLRRIGSNDSLYNSREVELSTKIRNFSYELFSEIYSNIVRELEQRTIPPYLADAGEGLGRLSEEINSLKKGNYIEVENETNQASESTNSKDFKVNLAPSGSGASFGSGQANKNNIQSSERTKYQKLTAPRLNYGAISRSFEELLDLTNFRLWIMIDEWSAVPYDLQPYVADVLRKTIFPISTCTVHIAAIEQRSNFYLRNGQDYTGIELGADATSSVNLDDFLVFENDPKNSTEFFLTMLFKHLLQFNLQDDEKPSSPSNLRQRLFNNKNTFEEFIRASEGVPRDSINLLARCVRKAGANKITLPNVRAAALDWFHQDKSSFLDDNKEADLFLRWLIAKVIGERQTRAFLVSVDDNLRTINVLYDHRLIHILKRSVSSHDDPGKRFKAFKLDYGCYIDLKNTNRDPKGLFIAEEKGGNEVFIEVPKDDYRSIRRAIVNVSEFDYSTAEEIIGDVDLPLSNFAKSLLLDVAYEKIWMKFIKTPKLDDSLQLHLFNSNEDTE